MPQILIASQNPHKIEKLTSIVSPYFEQIQTLKSLQIADNFAEEGSGFEQIASNKAKYFSLQYPEFVIATDGGMIIPALENWNPLYTRRFLNSLDKSDKNDFSRMDELLEKTKDLKGASRSMYWKEAVAIAKNGEILFSLEIEGNHGFLQTEYDKTKYKPGIWLCSLWSHPQFESKNFFDLTKEELKESEISWDKIKAGVEGFLG
jgi:inosine/xanthosine triphosphate pyrophosphatase family protein